MLAGCASNQANVHTNTATESTVVESTEAATENETTAAAEETSESGTVEETAPEPKIVMVDRDDFIAANTTGNILKNHDSYSTNFRVIADEHGDNFSACGFSNYSSYGNADTVFYSMDHTGVENSEFKQTKTLYTKTDEFDEATYSDGTTEAYKVWYAMTGDEKSCYLPDIKDIPFVSTENGEFPEDEHEATDNNDGTLTMVTTSLANVTAELPFIPDEWENGTIEYTYTLDADTLEIQNIKSKVILPDREFDFYEVSTEYDVEGSQEYKDMCDFAANYDVKPKHVTVIYDPDTNREERYEMETESSNLVKISVKDGYALFMDKEGTVPFEKPEVNEYTVYGLPIE